MSRITMSLENDFEGRVLASFDLDEFAIKVRADYEAECQKIFEDNPPMHFNHEQIMWLKEFVKIRCNQARADVIEEIKQSIIPTMYEFDVTQDTIDFCINILEQFKENNNG